MPRRFPLREVEPFVEEKRRWIERTLRRLRESEAELPAARLGDGGEVPYLGERLPLSVRVEPGRSRAFVARRAGRLHVAVAGADRATCALRSSAGIGAAPGLRSSPG